MDTSYFKILHLNDRNNVKTNAQQLVGKTQMQELSELPALVLDTFVGLKRDARGSCL